MFSVAPYFLFGLVSAFVAFALPRLGLGAFFEGAEQLKVKDERALIAVVSRGSWIVAARRRSW